MKSLNKEQLNSRFCEIWREVCNWKFKSKNSKNLIRFKNITEILYKNGWMTESWYRYYISLTTHEISWYYNPNITDWYEEAY